MSPYTKEFVIDKRPGSVTRDRFTLIDSRLLTLFRRLILATRHLTRSLLLPQRIGHPVTHQKMTVHKACESSQSFRRGGASFAGRSVEVAARFRIHQAALP